MVATAKLSVAPNEGAAEAFSEHLAIIEIAILKLQDDLDHAIAQIAPGDISWFDVARLTGIVQALRQIGLVTDADRQPLPPPMAN